MTFGTLVDKFWSISRLFLLYAPYLLSLLFRVIIVFNHAVNVVGKLVAIFDMSNTAGMYHIANTFRRPMLTRKRILRFSLFNVLKLEVNWSILANGKVCIKNMVIPLLFRRVSNVHP